MDIKVRHVKGGREETRRTGVYPNNLIFSSASLNMTWKERLTSDTQTGNLMVDGEIVVKYAYSGRSCKVQEVVDGISSPDWVEVGVSLMMVD